jgi:excisionase family DNA binding protein
METEEKQLTTYSISNLITISDYAKLRGVTRQTIYNWIAEKNIKTVDLLGKQYIDKSTAIK